MKEGDEGGNAWPRRAMARYSERGMKGRITTVSTSRQPKQQSKRWMANEELSMEESEGGKEEEKEDTTELIF